jgi:hypothetical protein
MNKNNKVKRIWEKERERRGGGRERERERRKTILHHNDCSVGFG